MKVNAIKEAIKANFVNNNYDAACALCEEQGLFDDYVKAANGRSLKSLLAYLRKQDNERAAAVTEIETTDVEEAPVTADEQVEVQQEEAAATDEPTKKEKKSKTSFFYFAVSVEDYNSGNVSPENALDGVQDASRLNVRRAMMKAGRKGKTYWTITAAKKNGEVVGYGANKKQALSAYFAA